MKVQGLTSINGLRRLVSCHRFRDMAFNIDTNMSGHKEADWCVSCLCLRQVFLQITSVSPS
jgi:hypothetical protein